MPEPRKSRARWVYVLPGSVILGAALVGLLTAPSQARGSSTGAYGSEPAAADASAAPSQGHHQGLSATRPDPAGGPITYSNPPSSYVAPGRDLFEANCASCHGVDATGGVGPNLVGVGSATVDFWVSTGRMPLAQAAKQAARKPPRFDRTETLELDAFVGSLAPPVDPDTQIPAVDLEGADLAQGDNLMVLTCGACHTVTGAGDSLASGYFAPSLHQANATQIAEAIRTGPGNMPRFGPGDLTDRQVADIVAYVRGPIQRPDNHGGLGLGGIGPVAEGFVGLLLGVGGLMAVAFWVGDRS